MKRSRRLLPALIVTALALPASAGAAAWDGSPLELAPAGSGPGALAVATTADGASWALWSENRDSGSSSEIVARRVSGTGVVGERRVLATDGSQYGAVALAKLSSTDVRVAYVTGAGLGTVVRTRRLEPAASGSPDVLYDKDVTDDGNVADNGPFSERLGVHQAPGGAVWIAWTRTDDVNPRTEARYVDAAGSAGSLVHVAPAYSVSTASAPSGDLVAAYPLGAQGQVLATRVATGAGAPEAPIVLRPSSPPSPPFFSVAETNIAIDPSGIATAGWRTDTCGTPSRFVEVARFDSAATPMLTQGGDPSALSDGLANDYVQYAPLLAAAADGDVLAAWYETTSFTDETDVLVRELGAGTLAPAAIGPRLQIDGPKPEGATPFAIVPEPASQTRVVFAGHDHGPSNTSFCRASRIGDGGVLIGTETIASGCASPAASPDAGDGLAVLWMASQATGQVRLSRWVEDAPTCSDGAPAEVQAGATVRLTLPCDGWRPVRETTTAPARGTLGAIDQQAGEIAYTAGAAPGGDEVRFRAVNAAGASAERRIAVDVTPAPEPPAPQPPAGPPAPPGPGAAAPPDSAAPVISENRVTPRRTRAGSRGGPLLSFRLSERAAVKIRVQVRAHGRRSGGRCRTGRKLTKALRRKPRCQTWLTVAGATRPAPAGVSTLRLRGSKGRPLPRGAYRVLVAATDAAGNRSREARTVFDVTR
jgi:hypothetical protein